MTKLLDRFGLWLGTWRGPATLEDGRAGIAEFSFQPQFGGSMIEVFGHSFDSESGHSQSWGMAHMALAANNRVIWRHYNQSIGFATMREIEDDPDVLTIEGQLANERILTLSWQFDQDDLRLTGSTHAPLERVQGMRTAAHMKRQGVPLWREEP